MLSKVSQGKQSRSTHTFQLTIGKHAVFFFFIYLFIFYICTVHLDTIKVHYLLLLLLLLLLFLRQSLVHSLVNNKL